MNYKLVPTLLTEPMSEVLRNEHCVYQTEQELYNALLEAAPAASAELEPVGEIDNLGPARYCVKFATVPPSLGTKLYDDKCADAMSEAADRLEELEKERDKLILAVADHVTARCELAAQNVAMRDALCAARRFIKNGIELGVIRMPDAAGQRVAVEGKPRRKIAPPAA